MNNPLTCWNCNKVFADLIKGNALLEASTNIEEPVKETQIEIKCPRCKKMNSIIVQNSNKEIDSINLVRKNEIKEKIKEELIKKFYDPFVAEVVAEEQALWKERWERIKDD